MNSLRKLLAVSPMVNKSEIDTGRRRCLKEATNVVWNEAWKWAEESTTNRKRMEVVMNVTRKYETKSEWSIGLEIVTWKLTKVNGMRNLIGCIEHHERGNSAGAMTAEMAWTPGSAVFFSLSFVCVVHVFFTVLVFALFPLWCCMWNTVWVPAQPSKALECARVARFLKFREQRVFCGQDA